MPNLPNDLGFSMVMPAIPLEEIQRRPRGGGLDGCLCLSVNDWNRRGLFKPGTTFTEPGHLRSRTFISPMEVMMGEFSQLNLRYRIRLTSGKMALTEYSVWLVWTECHYGGRRPWFLCPNDSCGRRVAKLYLPQRGRYYLCRHCCRLAYETLNASDWERRVRKVQSIRRRLGGQQSLMAPFPDKPKGMHWKTYHRLRREAQELGGRLSGDPVVSARSVEAFARLLDERLKSRRQA